MGQTGSTMCHKSVADTFPPNRFISKSSECSTLDKVTLGIPAPHNKIRKNRACSNAIRDLVFVATKKEIDIENLYESACSFLYDSKGCVTSLWDNISAIMKYGDKVFVRNAFDVERIEQSLENYSFVRIKDNDLSTVKNCLSSAQLVAAIVQLDEGVCCAACFYGYTSEDKLLCQVYSNFTQRIEVDLTHVTCMWTIVNSRNKINTCVINS
jgi:hypothetical protein